MASPACRFVLSSVREDEIRGENGFDLFEPDIALEIGGRNVFASLGRAQVPVVIMASRKEWLSATRELATCVDRGLEDGENEERLYPLYGTAINIHLRRPGTGGEVDVYLEWKDMRRHLVGRVPVRSWVQAVAMVSRELSDLFRRFHPSLFNDSLFARQELWLQEIESWLIAHPEERPPAGTESP